MLKNNRSIPFRCLLRNILRDLYGGGSDGSASAENQDGYFFGVYESLLAEKSYSKITVQEIIDAANVGRTTFYAHFETKDDLLKELCEELFGHIIGSAMDCTHTHGLYSDGSAPESVFCHLLQHLQENDKNIIALLSCESSEMFLRFFKDSLNELVRSQFINQNRKANTDIPEDFFDQPYLRQLCGNGTVVDQRTQEADTRGSGPLFSCCH